MFGIKKKQKITAGSATLAANLQDDQLRFKVIVDNIEDGVIMIDDQLVVRLINPSAAALCGWNADEATGIDVKNVMTLANDKGEPISSSDNPFAKVLKSGQPYHENSSFLVNHDKKQVPLSLNLSPLFDDQKQLTAVVAVFRDVSAERAQEQQRADFISTASHEMRTPVAAIEGYLSLALNNKVSTIDNRARDYLEKAHLSTKHLGKLFQDLLNSAKAEDGRLTSHPSVVELGAFLEQLTNDLRFVADKKGLFVEFVSGSTTTNTINATQNAAGTHVIRPLYYVYVDPDRLREVITNLFDNAVKYTAEGKVSVGLNGDAQVVQCFIRDTGPGIPAGDLPHLFQKFYRVDNSATRTIGGTGLGLFISRKIVELYNGRLWAESEMGKGSSFYINLPRLTSQQVTSLQAADASSAELKPISSLATP